jgi:hypothetical protein
VLLLILGIIMGVMFFILIVMDWAIGAIEVACLIFFVGYSVTYSLHVAHTYWHLRPEDNNAHLKLLYLEATERRAAAEGRGEAGAADGGDLRFHGVLQDGSPDSLDPSDAESGALGGFDGQMQEWGTQELRVARVHGAVMGIGRAVLSSAVSTTGSSGILLFSTFIMFYKLAAVLIIVTVLSVVMALVSLPAVLLVCGPAPDPWYKRELRRFLRRLMGDGSQKDYSAGQDQGEACESSGLDLAQSPGRHNDGALADPDGFDDLPDR